MAGQAADSSYLGAQAVHLPSACQAAAERTSAAIPASVGLALVVASGASRAFASHTWVGQPSAHKCPDLGRVP